MVKMEALLKKMLEMRASDLHIAANRHPHVRVDGAIIPIEMPALTEKDAKELCYSLLSEEQIARFEKNWEMDVAFGWEGQSRFRINIYKQRGCVQAAIRALPYSMMSFEECGLPIDVAIRLCDAPKGLVLVTGATGSGKSTTLAAMIDYINSRKPCHIITVEDPIEYIHVGKKAIIDQREVTTDTHSFGNALKYVLRQDPDVIMIGEMRDLETIEAALNSAETGHLVFATLHTSDTVQTINRIVDVFPAHQQRQIRTQLSFVLIGVFCQQLIPKLNTEGRVLSAEVMIVNPAIKSLIREEKQHQIYSVIQTGQRDGMRTLNQSLAELYYKHLISYDEALSRSIEPQELVRLMEKK
ncbi:MAG: type IV pilus twitching motility protein PilT [Candidatus Omnitrophota bacterium]